MKARRLWIILTIVGVLLAAAGIGIAMYEFTQTVPSGTAPPAGMVSGCGVLAVNTGPSVASGTDAENVYGCGTHGGDAAFNITGAALGSGSNGYTPEFTLGSGFTSSWVVPYPVSTPTNIGCGNITGAKQIETATQLGLPTGNWDYCFDSAPGATLGSFTISWSD
jgi:hypothetical protein